MPYRLPACFVVGLNGLFYLAREEKYKKKKEK
jgi:hypothetical protein